MAAPLIKRAIGNAASTTLSSSVTDSDTAFPLTSDTNFAAESGEGMALLDEGEATEELGYATGKSGASLTIPLANRGLEGGSAVGHASGASVKGVLTAGMWNDLVDAVLNILDQSTGAVKEFTLPTGGNIQVNSADPKRGFYIPASAFTPATTNGCASLAQSETSTNKLNYKTLDFDASTEEYAWLMAFPAPDYWDLSTITVKFHWTAASSTGDVIWGAAGVALSNDDALDTALGTAQTVTDTLIATGDVHTTAATSAITIGGTPAKGDMLFLRVYRDADAGGDTLGADAKLIAVTVKFGIGQYDDQ